jgi:hypothetical protein
MTELLKEHLQTIGLAGIMALGLVVAHDLLGRAIDVAAIYLTSCP